AGLDLLPQLPATAREIDPVDLDRQLERGPKDVEEPPVVAPTHGGFQGQGAGNRMRLPAFSRDEREFLAGTRDRHVLAVGRDRAPVPEEVESLGQGAPFAPLEVLDEDAVPFAGCVAPDEDRLSVRNKV